LNCAVAEKQVSTLDNATVGEGRPQRLSPMDGKEYRWQVLTTPETTKSVKSNMPPAKLVFKLRADPSFKIIPVTSLHVECNSSNGHRAT
jgi:hypothetical protein